MRWAAVESTQVLPTSSLVGGFRDRIAAKRGRRIAVVAAARRQVGLIYWALRDHHVRALQRPRPRAGAA